MYAEGCRISSRPAQLWLRPCKTAHGRKSPAASLSASFTRRHVPACLRRSVLQLLQNIDSVTAVATADGKIVSSAAYASIAVITAWHTARAQALGLLQDQPPVDLLIRTSGESRLSDFLLWQSATAQIAFVPALWPDFSYLDLLGAIVDYQLGYPAMQVQQLF